MSADSDVDSELSADLSDDESSKMLDDKPVSEEDMIKLRILHGSMTDLPSEQKNVIRLFISSTFTGEHVIQSAIKVKCCSPEMLAKFTLLIKNPYADMTVDRNMLMATVFPNLKKYCLDTYKREFQVVDMRWGVQSQASDDHSTSEICLREILNCQKESAGPHFVVFVGDRYGTRFLQKSIPEDHWSVLYNRVRSAEVKVMLDTWYKLDSNGEVPARILQPLKSIEGGADTWSSVSAQMYEAIRIAATDARVDGELPADICQHYVRSVTEEEVDCAGLLAEGETDNKSKALVFMRSMQNINTSHAKAGRFIDLKPDTTEIDTKAQDLLTWLKKKLTDSMPADNMKQYQVTWSDNNGLNADEHADYLKELAKDFYEQVKSVIDKCAASEDAGSKTIYDDVLTREVFAHTKQGIDRLSKVVPRNDILDKVKTYITGTSDVPLIVHGHSGCGKTSVMASVAQQSLDLPNTDGTKTAVALRFLGTTPASSDIELVLISLIIQLKSIVSNKVDKSNVTELTQKNLSDLTKEFHKAINAAKARKDLKLVLLLDSVDQLRNNEHAYNLSWVPEKLPPNVKFVLSTLPDIYGIYKAALKLSLPTDNYVEVPTLDEKSAWLIMDMWLTMHKKQLTEAQREVITQTFKGKELPPLYIKLVFDVIVKWRSYTESLEIPEDFIKCLEKLYDNLERDHGQVQMKLIMGYLTCCPEGISQAELEDTLSIDDIYLNNVYQYHTPPVRRIPPSLWVRIRNDIRDYIVEKISDGVTTMVWYHRQFIEYATKRYVTGQEYEKHCFCTLSDYFTGKWADKPKEFEYTDRQLQKLSEEQKKEVVDGKGVALRYVAPQKTRMGKFTFNGRKVNVLGEIWTQPILKDQSIINSARYLMDIEFLTGKFEHDLWSNISDELETLGDMMTDQSVFEGYKAEFDYVRSILQMHSGLFELGPLSLPAHLFDTMQDEYNNKDPLAPTDNTPPNLAWFLTTLISKDAGADICPLVPVAKHLESPGGMKIISRQTTFHSKSFSVKYNDQCMIGAFDDEEIVLHIINGRKVTEYASIPVFDIYEHAKHLSYGPEDNYLFCWGPGNFSLVSLENEKEEFSESRVSKDAIFTSVNLDIFMNPHISGKDSIMFSGYQINLVIIYSMKLRKVVWHRWIPDNEDEDGNVIGEHVEIFFASMNPAESDARKILEIVLNGQTEVYDVMLLENGGADVKLTKTVPNAWGTVNEKMSISVMFSHGESLMDVIIAPNQPQMGQLMVSSKTLQPGQEIHDWVGFEGKDKVKDLHSVSAYPVGRLKSGTNILLLEKECGPQDKRIVTVELYSVKDYKNIHYFATMPVDGGGTIDNVQLIPNLDVLLIAIQGIATFYSLKVTDHYNIEVQQAYRLSVAIETADVFADEFGFLMVTSTDSSHSIFDLVSSSIRPDMTESNPHHKTTEWVMQLLPLPITTAGNYFVSLQGHGYVWDAVTNKFMTTLPGNDVDDGEATIAGYFPGETEHQHYIAISFGDKVDIIKVDLPSEVNKVIDATFIHKTPLSRSKAIIYPKGVMSIVDDKGVLLDINCSDCSDLPSLAAKPRILIIKGDDSEGGPGSSWKKLGYTMMHFIHLDEYVLVTGDACDEDDDDAEPVTLTLLYDISAGFKLVKVYKETSFSYMTYFQKHGIAVATGFDPGLVVFDKKTLEFKNVFPQGDIKAKFTMIKSFTKEAEMHQTEDSPYFYVLRDGVGHLELLSLDVTKVDGWGDGEGVRVIGVIEGDSYVTCRITKDIKYLATTTTTTTINLYKISEEKGCIMKLGEYMHKGTFEKFAFTLDSKYIVGVDFTGAVISLKILDPTSTEEEFSEEVKCLPCTQCSPQSHVLVDPSDNKETNTGDKQMLTSSGQESKDLYQWFIDWMNLHPSAPVNVKLEPYLDTNPLVAETQLKKLEAVKQAEETKPPQSEDAVQPHPPSTPKPAEEAMAAVRLQATLTTNDSDKEVDEEKVRKATEASIASALPAPPPPPPLPTDTDLKKQRGHRLIQIKTDRRLIDHAKAYQEMPNEQKEKALDALVTDIKKDNSVMCNIL